MGGLAARFHAVHASFGMFVLAVLAHFSAEKAGGKQNESLPGPPQSPGMESTKDTGPTEAVGCTLHPGQSQNGNPGQNGNLSSFTLGGVA